VGDTFDWKSPAGRAVNSCGAFSLFVISGKMGMDEGVDSEGGGCSFGGGVGIGGGGGTGRALVGAPNSWVNSLSESSFQVGLGCFVEYNLFAACLERELGEKIRLKCELPKGCCAIQLCFGVKRRPACACW
jgi:hypothetical protein